MAWPSQPTHVDALESALGGAWSGGWLPNQAVYTILARGRSFIALMKEFGADGHFVVADGLVGEQVLVRDPWNGGSSYRMTMDEFFRVFTGYGVFQK